MFYFIDRHSGCEKGEPESERQGESEREGGGGKGTDGGKERVTRCARAVVRCGHMPSRALESRKPEVAYLFCFILLFCENIITYSCITTRKPELAYLWVYIVAKVLCCNKVL